MTTIMTMMAMMTMMTCGSAVRFLEWEGLVGGWFGLPIIWSTQSSLGVFRPWWVEVVNTTMLMILQGGDQDIPPSYLSIALRGTTYQVCFKQYEDCNKHHILTEVTEMGGGSFQNSRKCVHLLCFKANQYFSAVKCYQYTALTFILCIFCASTMSCIS